MKSIVSMVLAGACYGFAASGATGPVKCEGLNGFGGALYSKLAEGSKENLIFSPYSIHAAMGMTASGAKGETEVQLAKLLGEAATADERNRAAKALMDALAAAQAGGDVTLDVANRVWAQKNYNVLEDFQSGLKSAYGSAMLPADFVGNAEGVRKEINGWVSEKTRTKIQDLIPGGVLNAMTRMVLVNAIYFYGGWEKEFKKEATKDAPFFLADASQVTAPLMSAKYESLRYAERDGLQIAELPYKGGRLAMLVVLPKAGELAAAEQLVAKEGIDSLAKALRSRAVNLWLPRFKSEAQFGLAKTLASMGAPDAFDAGRADFSGITGSRDLFISDVIHKAVIEVNEKGTEAAAATAAVMARMSIEIREPAAEFRADRPFLYAIRDRQSGAVLFMGRLMKP